MGRKRRREFLVQSDQGRMKAFVLPFLALIGVVGLLPVALIEGGWYVAAALGLGGLGWWLWRKFRAGLLLTEDGFWELYYLRLPRRYRWDEVQSVDEQRDEARVLTRRGTVHVDDNLRTWRRFVARARQALGEPVVEDEPGPQIPPEKVEEWLDVPSGGSVRYRVMSSTLIRAVIAAVVCLFVVVAALAGSMRAPWFSLMPLLGMLLWLLMPLVMYRLMGSLMPTRVEAKGDGLYLGSLRDSRRVGWNTIRSIRRRGPWRIACTTEGDFQFAADNAAGKRLLAALEAAIAARDEGFALPRMTEVSDAALSPVRPETESAERGLSSISTEDDTT